MLNCHLANHCTKFEVSSFSHSGDIVEGTKNLNRSRDRNGVTFLVETTAHGVLFIKPGAMHQACWMSKVLYSLKIWAYETSAYLLSICM